jgi:hypothetical protein
MTDLKLRVEQAMSTGLLVNKLEREITTTLGYGIKHEGRVLTMHCLQPSQTNPVFCFWLQRKGTFQTDFHQHTHVYYLSTDIAQLQTPQPSVCPSSCSGQHWCLIFRYKQLILTKMAGGGIISTSPGGRTSEYNRGRLTPFVILACFVGACTGLVFGYACLMAVVCNLHGTLLLSCTASRLQQSAKLDACVCCCADTTLESLVVLHCK